MKTQAIPTTGEGISPRTAPRILIIEDDVDMADLVSRELRSQSYEVHHLDRGVGRVECALKFRPDLVILDLMLPDMSGFEVCRAFRESPSLQDTIIIVFSGRCIDADIVESLEVGADDHIPKSTSGTVFLAKLRAALRRKLPELERAKVLTWGPIGLDVETQTLLVDGERHSATHSEARLAELLLLHPNRIFSRSEIVEFLRGRHYHVTERSVDVLVVNLRKKFGAHATLIETVRQRGYRFHAAA
ncbi:MAG: response regulator transcription factor [Deltaproteobacteria bacterium]|nr:response regulator transcription factor [Deltaproteobacteria bacterium]